MLIEELITQMAKILGTLRDKCEWQQRSALYSKWSSWTYRVHRFRYEQDRDEPLKTIHGEASRFGLVFRNRRSRLSHRPNCLFWINLPSINNIYLKNDLTRKTATDDLIEVQSFVFENFLVTEAKKI
jgi:hypothetical protein